MHKLLYKYVKRKHLVKFMVVVGYRLPHTQRDYQILNRKANSYYRLTYKGIK